MNGKLIIKIAVGVSVAAFLFSLITLVRALSLNYPAAFPMIQFIGSAVILAVCCIMLYMMRDKDQPFDEPEAPADDSPEEPDTRPLEAGSPEAQIDAAKEAVDDLYEKYHLSDFE